MDLKPQDLHLMLSRPERSAKLYNAQGKLLLAAEARNRTTNDQAPPSEHDAPCPPGTFLLGAPVTMNTPPFGAYFIPMLDFGDSHVMADNHRSGIGLHAGGSGLPNWNADQQGWVITHGCWRLQGGDLRALVHWLDLAASRGGRGYATVAPFQPGAVEWLDDLTHDYADIDPSQLAPDE